VFGLSQVTIISDRFHNYRAVFLAQHAGLDAVAYCAKPVPLKFQTKATVRECLARPKALLDLYVLRKKPRFLGEKVQIRVSRD
jgi:SanA protein